MRSSRLNGPARSAYANYVLVILFIAYVINFVDRQIISILAEPIKKALGVSDSWIGFLGGPAFAIFYAVLSFNLLGYGYLRQRQR